MPIAKEKQLSQGKQALKIMHQEIASDMGTVREVISRAFKKLEIKNKVLQTPEGIKMVTE